MKLSWKTAGIACIVLAMGLASCILDDNEKGGAKDNGDPTSITVSLNFPASQVAELRATSDPNATEAEAKINTVDVFIYSGSGYFISHTSLSPTDFTQVSSGNSADQYVYSNTTKIPTTTGPKKVFVAVNLPSDVIAALEHKPTSELTQIATALSYSQLVSDAGSLAMSSIELLNCNFEKDATVPANNPTATVKRMVAKITVQKASNMVQAGVPGTLSSLSFGISNFNLRSFIIQSPDHKDPNWDSYDAGEFSAAATADYVLVNEATVTDVKNLTSRYASENTSQLHRTKEITRAVVRGAFLPEKVVISQGVNYTTVTSVSQGVTDPRTFYTVTLYRPEPEIICFFDKDVATAYAVANDRTAGDVVTFVDGICYWDMYLNKEGIWDVYRNDYYKCSITRILFPGRPTDDLPNPEDPPAADTNITVNVDVLDWNNPVLEDYELEP